MNADGQTAIITAISIALCIVYFGLRPLANWISHRTRIKIPAWTAVPAIALVFLGIMQVLMIRF